MCRKHAVDTDTSTERCKNYALTEGLNYLSTESFEFPEIIFRQTNTRSKINRSRYISRYPFSIFGIADSSANQLFDRRRVRRLCHYRAPHARSISIADLSLNYCVTGHTGTHNEQGHVWSRAALYSFAHCRLKQKGGRGSSRKHNAPRTAHRT